MEDDGAIVARVFPDPSGDERAAAEERERAEEERVKRKKEARREQEERERRGAANEARLAAAANILFYIVLPLSVCAAIAIGVVRVGAAIVADAASPVPESSALTRCLLWYAVAGVISFFLLAGPHSPNVLGGGCYRSWPSLSPAPSSFIGSNETILPVGTTRTPRWSPPT